MIKNNDDIPKKDQTEEVITNGVIQKNESPTNSSNDDKNEVSDKNKEKSVNYLLQKVHKEVIYPVDCKYFSVVNSFLMAGLEPIIKTNNLSEYVHNKIVAANYKLSYVSLIKDIFGINVKVNPINPGMTPEDLFKTIGNNPAVFSFDQNKFWGALTLHGSHGVSFYIGTY